MIVENEIIMEHIDFLVLTKQAVFEVLGVSCSIVHLSKQTKLMVNRSYWVRGRKHPQASNADLFPSI